MVGPALIVIIFAVTCCGLALWVVVARPDATPQGQPVRPNPLAGMSADALELVRRANRNTSRASLLRRGRT